MAGMACRSCTHYDPSTLPRYGFCKAAPTLEERARFFHGVGACWLSPVRFQERQP